MKAPAPLPDDLNELLDAERDIDPPTPAERERMYTRLAPLMLPPIAADVGQGIGHSASATGALKAKIGIALVAAAIGAGGGAAGHAYYVSKKAPVVAAATIASAPSVAAIVLPPVVSEAPPVVESITPVTSAPPVASARGPSTLRAERLLIETASSALARGDKDAAIAALTKHAQRFPKGQLAPEREVLLKSARAK